MLDDGAENLRILREILLRKGRDGATRRRVGDAEPHLVADRELAPDPVVLDEALPSEPLAKL